MLQKRVLFIFTIVTMTVMNFLDIPLKNEIAKNGIVSFELARTLQSSINILNSWDPTAKLYAGISLGFDYLFMLIYSLLLYTLTNHITSKFSNKSTKKIGKLLAIAMLFAGISDAIENYALIKLYLGHLDQIFSTIAYYSATLKFSIIGIGIIYLMISYFYFIKIMFTEKDKIFN